MTELHIRLDEILSSRLLRNVGVYAISYGIYALIPLALLPILTRYLSPSQYGEIAMFQLLVTLLTPLIGLNTIGLVTIDFFKDQQKSGLQSTHSAIVLIWFVTSAISLLLILLFHEHIIRHLGLRLSTSIMALVACSANFLITLRLSNWQIRGKTIRYSLLLNSVGLINITVTLILIVLFHYGALGRITGQTASAFLMGIVAWFLMKKDNIIVIKKISMRTVSAVTMYGSSLLPHVLGLVVFSTADRYLLNHYLDLEAVGIYAVAFQISFVISLLVESFNKAYTPWLFEKLGKEGEAATMKTIVMGTYLYFLTVLCLAGLFWAARYPFVDFFLGSRFKDAGALIGYLALGHAFSGMYLMVNNYIHFHKKNLFISMTTLGVSTFHILLLVALLAPYGIEAAAISYAIAQFARFAITWYLANHVHPMPWKRA